MEISDYRCAIVKKYANIKKFKKRLLAKINRKHRTENHYSLIHPNNGQYKELFMQCYDNKCVYCGIPKGVIKNYEFEIDHFLPKSNIDSNINKISNLVLSCNNCNRNKNGFIPIEDDLHPDNLKLQKIFKRNTNFEIIISDEYKNKKNVQDFYDKMKFDSIVHRLDFVLMYLRELIDQNTNSSIFNNEISIRLEAVYGKLLDKRNCIR